MILAGKSLKARKAAKIGLVDEVGAAAAAPRRRPGAGPRARGREAPPRAAAAPGGDGGARDRLRARGELPRPGGRLPPGAEADAREDEGALPGPAPRPRRGRVRAEARGGARARARGAALRRARGVAGRAPAHGDLLRDDRAQEGQRHGRSRRSQAAPGREGGRARRRAHGQRHRLRHRERRRSRCACGSKDDAAAAAARVGAVRGDPRRAGEAALHRPARARREDAPPHRDDRLVGLRRRGRGHRGGVRGPRAEAGDGAGVRGGERARDLRLQHLLDPDREDRGGVGAARGGARDALLLAGPEDAAPRGHRDARGPRRRRPRPRSRSGSARARRSSSSATARASTRAGSSRRT